MKKIDNTRAKIMMVDDNMANLTIGKNLIKTFHEVYPLSSAAKLFEILEKVMPDLIMLDIEMPEMSGYEAIEVLKSDQRFSEIPVIFLTSKADEDSEMKGFDLGAVDYVTKPFSGPLLLKRIENQLLIAGQKKELFEGRESLRDYADNLKTKVDYKTKEVVGLQNAILSTVSDLVEFRDKSTGGHITRTKLYLEALVEEIKALGMYEDEWESWDMDFFLTSSQLHDVGKIAITDLILNKPGKLDPEEFEIMKTHVTVGVDAIEKMMNKTEEHDFLNYALLIAGTHHEKWDGSGYPFGLKGMNIPLQGRLMAIADVYDALIAVRPYKKALPHSEACKIIEEGAGKHFDPWLVEAFINREEEFDKIAKAHNADTDSSEAA